jgi:hypothetical protein
MILKQYAERPFSGVIWHGLAIPKHLPDTRFKKPSNRVK